MIDGIAAEPTSSGTSRRPPITNVEKAKNTVTEVARRTGEGAFDDAESENLREEQLGAVLLGILEEVLGRADRVVLMADASIVEVGTPEHFFTDPQEDSTKLFLSQIL